MKKWLLGLLAVLLILLLAACGEPDVLSAKEKTFSSGGMKITLNNAFRETTAAGYTVAYSSSKVAIVGLKEPFSSAEQLKTMTLSEYADAVYQSNASKSPKAIETVEGLTTLEYELHSSDQNKDYSYFTVMLQGIDCFWMFQFACETKNYEEYKPYFIKWAKTVNLTVDEV